MSEVKSTKQRRYLSRLQDARGRIPVLEKQVVELQKQVDLLSSDNADMRDQLATAGLEAPAPATEVTRKFSAKDWMERFLRSLDDDQMKALKLWLKSRSMKPQVDTIQRLAVDRLDELVDEAKRARRAAAQHEKFGDIFDAASAPTVEAAPAPEPQPAPAPVVEVVEEEVVEEVVAIAPDPDRKITLEETLALMREAQKESPAAPSPTESSPAMQERLADLRAREIQEKLSSI